MGTPGSSAAQCSRRTRDLRPAQPSARATAQTAMDCGASSAQGGRGFDAPCCRWSRRRRSTRRAGLPRRWGRRQRPRSGCPRVPSRESPTCGAVLRIRRKTVAGEPQVQQARHDPRDFVRLVEAPLDETRRVQGHGHDQCRASPWSAVAHASACPTMRVPKTRAFARAPSYLSACTSCVTGNS